MCSRRSKTSLDKGCGTLDIVPFEQEYVFPPQIVRLSNFLQTLAECDLQRLDRATDSLLEELVPLLHLQCEPRVHEYFADSAVA